jgi:ABC-2 type transport system ATP-binding protein
MRRAFFRLIDELAASGVTVLLTTHFLDEAEYCQRVVLISRGRVLADDTPTGLKALLGSPVIVEVRSDRSGDALAALARVPTFREAALFGAGVHALAAPGVTEADAISAAADALARGGVPASDPVAIPATLEDVFMELVRREEASG